MYYQDEIYAINKTDAYIREGYLEVYLYFI